MKKIKLIGYSGHAFVVIESAKDAKRKVIGYYEPKKKRIDPFKLKYLGSDKTISTQNDNSGLFIAIGDNLLRRKIYERVNGLKFTNIVDPSANVSKSAKLEDGIYIGKNVVINTLSKIGKGVIINTAVVIEHECEIGNFSHIAPGSVLCGNVKVGQNTLIGAGSVIRPGIKIGNNVIVGAGTVIVKDIKDNTQVYGSPLVLRKL